MGFNIFETATKEMIEMNEINKSHSKIKDDY